MIKISTKRNIVFTFLSWQFYEAPRWILAVWRNYLAFYWDYFSIGFLLKTLLAPWREQAESYGRGFDLKQFANAFAANLISRILGAIVRVVTIIIGLLFELAAFLAGLAVLIIWLLWPLLLLSGLTIGLYLII